MSPKSALKEDNISTTLCLKLNSSLHRNTTEKKNAHERNPLRCSILYQLQIMVGLTLAHLLIIYDASVATMKAAEDVLHLAMCSCVPSVPHYCVNL